MTDCIWSILYPIINFTIVGFSRTIGATPRMRQTQIMPCLMRQSPVDIIVQQNYSVQLIRSSTWIIRISSHSTSTHRLYRPYIQVLGVIPATCNILGAFITMICRRRIGSRNTHCTIPIRILARKTELYLGIGSNRLEFFLDTCRIGTHLSIIPVHLVNCSLNIFIRYILYTIFVYNMENYRNHIDFIITSFWIALDIFADKIVEFCSI